ncbi:MAG: stage II sporulation protein M [Candidatus Aenigmarchaeota archaeon]|nr:stage II sporulation protein M [Candidatus Aenigmarchaeota archaeon]
MVLESILNPKNAEDKPWHVFIIAFIYTIIAIYFADQIFPTQASMLTITIITLVFVPFFQKLFVVEEEKEDIATKRASNENLFIRHAKIIYVFAAFFMGIIFAMSFIFIFFPNESVFELQSKTIEGLSTGSATFDGNFMLFFLNNTQVMLLVFILSAVLGAGAIFILAWNASVIAVYLGLIVNSFVKQGFETATAYMFGVPVGLLSIALHGIPEIAAYFFAGLAGGILSVGIIREKMNSKEFKNIFKDSLIILAIAECLIISGAFIEAML